MGSRGHVAGLDAAPESSRTSSTQLDELTSALNGLATYWNQAGACRKSIEIAERILGVAEVHDLRAGRLRGHCTFALNHLFLGDAPLSLQHARHAIALYEPEDFHTVTYGFGTDQGVVAYIVAGAVGLVRRPAGRGHRAHGGGRATRSKAGLRQSASCWRGCSRASSTTYVGKMSWRAQRPSCCPKKEPA